MRRWSIGLLATVALFAFPGWSSGERAGEVFRKVSPSVVVIRAKGRDVVARGEVMISEIGSGVLISDDGKVMTAAHVVHVMDQINVEFIGGETVRARVIASEPAADLSMLQLERVPQGARPAPLADSDKVQVGDQVVVVGAPYGLSYSLSVGWISARWAPNTVYRSMPMAEFFQTDATINTGNSGGPMFNMVGEVIGIVSHNVSKSGGSEGLGFVVTSNSAKQLLLERRSFWGGVEGTMLSDELADLLNLPRGARGYLVKTVAKGSPAEAIGMRGGTTPAQIGGEEIVLGGDIILTVLDIPVGTPGSIEKMRDALSGLSAGDELVVTVLRAGRRLELRGRLP